MSYNWRRAMAARRKFEKSFDLFTPELGFTNPRYEYKDILQLNLLEAHYSVDYRGGRWRLDWTFPLDQRLISVKHLRQFVWDDIRELTAALK